MISFVYFDVGGVCILDFSGTNKWKDMQRDLGVTVANQALFETVWKRTRDHICIDRDVDSLLPMFTTEIGLEFPQKYSMLDDFVNRFESNPSIWLVIEKIRKVSRIGLLTNMYPRLFDAIQKRGILPPISWDVVIDSSVVKYQKPDKHIFEIAERQAKTSKESILFVENNVEHIRAAQNFGWQTFLYDPVHPKESSQKLSLLF